MQCRDEFVECVRGMPDGLEGGQSALLYRYHVVVGIARDQLAHGIDTCFSRQLIDRDSEVAPVLIDLLLLQVEESSGICIKENLPERGLAIPMMKILT